MSLNRYAAKVDANQAELVKLARRLGMQVEIIGKPVDAVVTVNQRMYWLEFKAKKGKYTKAQLDFIDRCALHGSPMLTWRTSDDVLACYEGSR